METVRAYQCIGLPKHIEINPINLNHCLCDGAVFSNREDANEYCTNKYSCYEIREIDANVEIVDFFMDYDKNYSKL